jgi:hypothetical protein
MSSSVQGLTILRKLSSDQIDPRPGERLLGPNGDVSGSMLVSRIGTQSKFVGSNPEGLISMKCLCCEETGWISREPSSLGDFARVPQFLAGCRSAWSAESFRDGRSHSHPDCGSFELWFADGRQSEWFYWDNSGRASITQEMDSEQAVEAAINLARIAWAKLPRAS